MVSLIVRGSPLPQSECKRKDEKALYSRLEPAVASQFELGALSD